jgi:hypothetical protein
MGMMIRETVATQPGRLRLAGIAACSLALVLILPARPAGAQVVIQDRGGDATVDYESLKAFGPWDDRNYQLTRADLALLSPEEDRLRVPIPVFFRVLLRRNIPDLPTEGPAQYPRSALQIFLRQCGGYLVNRMLYTQVSVVDGRFVVTEENGVEYRPSETSSCG